MAILSDEVARLLRQILEDYAETIRTTEGVTSDQIVKVAIGFPYYKQEGTYHVGDVRRHPDTEQPFKCILEYDASVQTTWTLDTPTLWIPYHGISKTTAYPWSAPTGAHDMYKAGEYMTYTDGTIYKCLSDTAYSPTEYAQAWEAVE